MSMFQNKQSSDTFNMMPIIDVVFLLIIFFLLVCRFIVAENFEVAVPAQIANAQPPETAAEQTTTVTVMFEPGGNVSYAVGAQKITPTDSTQIAGAIAEAIDKQLKNLPLDKRVVSLRNDKNITYRYTQHALAAISQSTATDIKWAVIKQTQKKTQLITPTLSGPQVQTRTNRPFRQ